MSDEGAHSEIDEAKRQADEKLGGLEEDATRMDDRLSEHESDAEEIEVPQPDKGDGLSLSQPDGEDEPEVSEDDVPDDEGEAADEAGQ
ncbi:MAG: hypothetical protein WKF62_07260 [Solirubrobacterales bacterium]